MDGVTDLSAPAAASATGAPLARYTTLRVGGPARRQVTATTTDAIIDAVSECDARGEPVATAVSTLVVRGGE